MGKPAQNSFFSWLGRQVGHVKKAVEPPAPPPTQPTPAAQPKVIYRNDKVEVQDMPDQPGVKLRRTTIDEVIVDPRRATLAPPDDRATEGR